MTHGKAAIAGSKRLAWFAAATAIVLASIAFGRDIEGANAWIQPPSVFSVTQSPNVASTVSPGDTVTFTVNETLASPANVLVIQGTIDSGLAFTGSPFNGSYAAVCSTTSATSFSCNGGATGAGAIPALVVSTVVLPASDGATISQAANSFSTQDGAVIPAGGVVTGPGSSLPTLTVTNETLAVTTSASVPTTFEGGIVTFTVGATNTTPSAGTGHYSTTLSLTSGTVQTVHCPTGASGSFTATSATCDDPVGLAMGASSSPSMSVDVQANNTTGGGTLDASLAVGGLVRGSGGFGASATIVELTMTGPTSSSTGAAVTICSTNSAASASVLAGFSGSHTNPFVVGDFILTPSGGATVSSPAVGNCPSQQGITFTSSTAGTITVTAGYNSVGRSNAVAVTFTTANNPAPTTSNIAPSTANAGSSGFTLTVNGSGFIASSQVQWNGSNRTTSYVSPNQLTASIGAVDILNPGTASVTVVNPTPGGGTSNAQTFTISSAPNPVPSISSVSPTTAIAGGAQFTLNVMGSNFVAGSQVKWNGSLRTTVFVDATHLNATITSGDIATPTGAAISVFNPTPGGGDSATTVPFLVESGATKLGFTTQPGNGVAGMALSTQPVVTVLTSGGTPVTYDSSTVVTLQLVGSGTLTCTGGLSKTASSGVATFAGCSVDTAATGLAIMANATSLTSATSSGFDVTAAPPTSSAQLVVAAPATGVNVARSRLTFSASTGTLAPTPTSATFIIKRKSDNKYWNNTSFAWESSPVENVATAGSTSGTWVLAITGANRRLFVNTTVVVTAHATSSGTVYESAVSPEIPIR